jgi:hypothetical protein
VYNPGATLQADNQSPRGGGIGRHE